MLADNAYVCYSTNMKRWSWVVVSVIVVVLSVLGIVVGVNFIQPVVLQPSGPIGVQQRDLLLFATVIMSAVALPVFVLLAVIVWRHRAGNERAASRYKPSFQGSPFLETLWWGIPILVVVVLSVVAWQTSHSLDPFRPIESTSRTLKVQVVALQWKWLFIYPDHNVASVNELYIPVQSPVQFEIAADAPMNSFWIPELGGQIYAMNGMSTKLHLEASRAGTFRGVSSNISGEGFADMKFAVHAVGGQDFLNEMSRRKQSSTLLDMAYYDALAVPNTLTEPQWFRLDDVALYHEILDKYHLPISRSNGYDESMNTTMHEGMH